MDAYAVAAMALQPVDPSAAAAAFARHEILTKPSGSLGSLEALGARLSAIARRCPPPVPRAACVVVFAADHGVVAEGVSAWPAEVTVQMVHNIVAGGAAINVLAAEAGARVVVVDVGVATTVRAARDAGALVLASIRPGTANIAVEAAMTRAEASSALDVGARTANRLAGEGIDCLLTGDMGIGNTTTAAALVAAYTGRPGAAVTGTGAGLAAGGVAHKTGTVDRSLARARAVLGPDLAGADPVALLAEIGGLEIAALAGFILAGAASRLPVVLDGPASLAAALVARAISAEVTGYCIAGHRSAEPAASLALSRLGLEPLLDLGLRLGEGTGACLALPLVRAAARILSEMATFESTRVGPSR